MHSHVGFCHTNIPLPCCVTCGKSQSLIFFIVKSQLEDLKASQEAAVSVSGVTGVLSEEPGCGWPEETVLLASGSAGAAEV